MGLRGIGSRSLSTRNPCLSENIPDDRAHDIVLTPAQEQELWLGSDPRHGSIFQSHAELHAAWAYHRDRVMERYARDGRRPLAWWRFESSFPWPGRDRERSALFRAGVLADDERAELVAWWRQEFDKAQAPGFTFCAGPGSFLRGVEARRRHLRWADVPPELVEQWLAEPLVPAAAESPAA